MWPVEQRIPRVGAVLLCAALLWPEQPVLAQFTQGPKLVGPNAIGVAGQGFSVALSADSSWVIVGGPGDNGSIGAVWFFVRSGRTWVPFQKLSATDAVGSAPRQGSSVAMSADGTTAIMGGPGDSSALGAAWIFTRSGGVWSPQTTKLVGNGAVNSLQGLSVALSADGNTAIVGGPQDTSNTGAAWVFTRSGGVWSEQGNKLVGNDSAGNARQGLSVALSADGNTAIVGGPCDNASPPIDCNNVGGVGAAWVFTRSGGVWTQQGPKLVGSNAVGNANQGESVALSADGNTAIVGGFRDSSSTGAAWVFTRSGGMWSQQGNKLVANDAIGSNVQQGFSVALSADSNTALVGGFGDNSRAGAAWVFTRSGGMWSQQEKLFANNADGNAEQGASVALFCYAAIVGGPEDSSASGGAAWVFVRPATATHDFSCDGLSDILWWNSTTGQAVIWLMNGSSIVGGGSPGSAPTDWAIVGQRDFNSDGYADIVWRNGGTGQVLLWFLNAASVIGGGSPGSVTTDWTVAGIGDFNDDRFADLLWYNTNTGQAVIWYLNGTSVIAVGAVGSAPSPWTIAGTGDFNGDGFSDILWYNTSTGQAVIWLLQFTSVIGGGSPGTAASPWMIAGTGDFNGDGKTDILWYNTSTGQTVIWLLNGTSVIGGASPGSAASPWTIVETGDYNGDGMSDILWWNSTTGQVVLWFLNGTSVIGGGSPGSAASPWRVQGMNAD
jgi:hypothetical protein